MKKKLLAGFLTATMVATMAMGCASTDNSNSESSSESTSSTESTSVSNSDNDTSDAESDVVLKVFSNLPDRKNGQGLVEQMIIDEYMAENPNVTIEVEALDEEAYKTKFKAYSMEGMPDVVNIWGQPSFLDEVLDAGVLAELNEADYADYGFISGSLDGFKKDGKLYGLPRNTDVAGFYYNEKMFQDNGWEIPTTYDELLTLAKTISDAGITPLAMDGGDGWPMAVYLSDILYKVAGSEYASIVGNAISTGDFSAPELAEATDLLRATVEAGLFQNGYDSQDYGTAQNLFTNGQAAMFYMGSWEASIGIGNVKSILGNNKQFIFIQRHQGMLPVRVRCLEFPGYHIFHRFSHVKLK